MRALRRNSILGPLMLVTIGILLLLLEMGNVHPDVFLLWMARWWPTILLGAGFVLLAEWAADTWVGGQRGAVLPRRSLGPGGVFLLVLVTLAGLSSMGLHRGSDWVRHNWDGELADSWGLDEVFAQHSATDQELNAPIASGALLTIQNYHGNINVTGASPDGQVHVSVHQRFTGWRGDDLRARKRRDTPLLRKAGAGLVLIVPGEGRDRSDLTIEVPHETALAIAPEKGDLSISELRGSLTVGDHSGNLVLTGLTGGVHLKLRDDNATVTGHSLSGDLTLEGRSGDLAFSDVSGPLTLHGDFFGSTHLERIAGPVHFQSSFTDLTCAGVPGEMNVEGRSELQAHNIDGPVVLSTTDRNLTLSGVRHGATISNRNGSVTLALADPLGPLKVATTDGSIELRVPDKASFALAAETADGQVNNDFGLIPKQQENRSSLTAQIHKGGPELSLRTSDGDITIHKGADTAAAEEMKTSEPTTGDSSEASEDHSAPRQHLRRLSNSQ